MHSTKALCVIVLKEANIEMLYVKRTGLILAGTNKPMILTTGKPICTFTTQHSMPGAIFLSVGGWIGM